MDKRIEFHEILCDILGSRNVYFQPPESTKIDYPAIVYERSSIKNTFADDLVYLSDRCYAVTLIDKNPDSKIIDRILNLPKVSFNRHFVNDNLNHDVFMIFY